MVNLQNCLSLGAALLPFVHAQANTSYVNYATDPQPDLTPLTVALIDLSFPDCSPSSPLGANLVCNTSANYADRAAALIAAFTLDELVNNTGNTGGGVPRLGLPNYQVWNEGNHGLDRANNAPSGDFSWATSFPQPILTAASLNRTLMNLIGSTISTQARAYSNAGRYGLDAYAPNINGFRSPIWGRGQETPGEDAFYLSSEYAFQYITGLQGGVNPETLKLVATAKHFAGYDLENWHNHSRLGNDLNITQQDLAAYYTPQFLSAVVYARSQSAMCSYNSVNGVPSCANSYFLQDILRDSWGFDGYVSSDCDAVYNVFNPHRYAANQTEAAGISLKAGTDIDCGQVYQSYLNGSFADGEVSRGDIERGVTRLYSSLVRLGYFNGNDSMYRDLTWDDVVSTDAQNISYQGAVQGTTLLKNLNNTLPLATASIKSVALIGPWANATVQNQGNYFGPAPYLTSLLAAAQRSNPDLIINYAFGTNISSTNTTTFAAALTAARNSDAVIFAGGIDNTVEAEGMDRESLTWPGVQLQLIHQLGAIGKPTVVLQMGGGQVDSSAIKSNQNIGALIWGGYGGQSGGQAMWDILTGVQSPAGRLVTTQYPAGYVNKFDQTDLNLRPNATTGNPGQTYMWYKGNPVYAFGTGLFYTNFSVTSATVSAISTTVDPSNNINVKANNATVLNIQDLLSSAHPDYTYIEQIPVLNFTAQITNTGATTSDYTAMLFAHTGNAGPAPRPNKWLVGFDRLSSLAPGESQTMTIPVEMRSLSRFDDDGNMVLYPGTYTLELNNEKDAVMSVRLTGQPGLLRRWPKQGE